MPRLLVNYGTAAAWEIDLHPGVNLLGRDDANDVPLLHDSVAVRHCQIVLTDGSARLQDLGSGKGTTIDLQPVRETVLRNGQIVRIGAVELLFCADVPPAVPPAPVAPEPLAIPLLREFPPPQPVPLPIAAREEPPIPLPLPATRSIFCRNHPQTIARLECRGCHSVFCEACPLPSAQLAGTAVQLCPLCGGECFRLDARARARISQQEPAFFAAMVGCFRYPLQGDGVILLVAGTLFYFLLNLRGFGLGGLAIGASLTLGFFGAGYLLAFLTSIVTTTAAGEDHLPDWPDFSDWSDIVNPFALGIGTLLGCFLPAILFAVFAQGQVRVYGLAASLGLGALYLPMAFLGVAMFDNLGALDPRLVLRSIVRVYREYAVVCAFLGLLLAARYVLDNAFATLPLPVIPTLLQGFVGMYFLTVEMRILGLLYRTRRAALGWFSH